MKPNKNKNIKKIKQAYILPYSPIFKPSTKMPIGFDFGDNMPFTKLTIVPIGDNAGFNATGKDVKYDFLGISFRKEETRNAVARVDEIFKRLDQLEKDETKLNNDLDSCYDRILAIEKELAKYDWIAPKMELLTNRLDALINAQNATYKRFIEAEQRIEKVNTSSPEYKSISLFLDEQEKYALINSGSQESIEKELDLLELELNKTIPLEKDLEGQSNLFDSIEKQLNDIQTEEEALYAEVEVLREVAGAVNRKANREGRQLARRVKRLEKSALKKDLRAKYGKGKDYRQAKRVGKKAIKEKKKKAMDQYGGTFGRRTWQATKSVGLAVPRNAFLLLTKLNVFALATKMDLLKRKHNKEWEKVKDMWGRNWAGDITQLEKEIERGKDKRPILNKDLRKDAKYSAIGGVYYNLTGAEELATPIVQSTPLWVQVGGFVSSIGSGVGVLLEVADKFGLLPDDVDTPNPNKATDSPDYLAFAIGILNKYNIPSDVYNKMLEELKKGALIEDILAKYGLQPKDDSRMIANGIDPNTAIPKENSNLIYWIGGGVAFLLLGLLVYSLTTNKK